MTKTQEVMARSHARLLRLYNQDPSEERLDRLVELTVQMNGEGVVYVGEGHYEYLCPREVEQITGGGK